MPSLLHETWFCVHMLLLWKSFHDLVNLHDTWCPRISARTGWPRVNILLISEIAGLMWCGVSVLWWSEIAGFIFNFYLSVAAHKIVYADLFLIYTDSFLRNTWHVAGTLSYQETNTAFDIIMFRQLSYSHTETTVVYSGPTVGIRQTVIMAWWFNSETFFETLHMVVQFRNFSLGSGLGSLSCVMQRRRFNPPQSLR